MRQIALAIVLTVAAMPAFAHCDSMKGPLITEAKQALQQGDVTPVLKWVPSADEQAIRTAFAKTIAARAASPEAREVADQWFFETLVRVHRQAEGASFTGLKGEEYKPEEGIELADTAIETGTLADAEKALTSEVAAGLRARFAAVQEAKKRAGQSIEEGRHFVHAYVEFIHYVERLHENATSAAGHHER
ncbi:MAG TPA: DUF6448 family protein [Thermoanaerobaculia bacterium]